LLVEVVKMALESANVQVDSIVEDGGKRASEIEARIAVLSREVAQREEEISKRRDEIATLETERTEISRVREQLGVTRSAAALAVSDHLPATNGALTIEPSDLDDTEVGLDTDALELT
jgi:hypothetical protein